MYTPSIPESLLSELSKIGLDPVNLVSIFESDLASFKQYGTSYLLLFDSSIIVADNHRIIRSFTLAEIDKIRLDERFGLSRLVACRKGIDKDIIYFTKSRSAEFSATSRLINNFIKTGQFPHNVTIADTHCPSCTNPLPESGGKCPLCVPKLKVFRRLLSYLQEYKARIWIIVVFTFVAVIAQMVTPYVTKIIVDDVILAKDPSALLFWISCMILAGFTYLVSRWLISIWSSWLSARLVAKLRSDLHAHLQKLNLDYFSKRASGDIMSKVMQDTAEIQQFLIEGLPFLLVNSISFIAIAIILISIDLWLALLVFFPVPLLVVGISWIWKRMYPMFLKRNSYRGDMNAVLNESIRGVKAIKASVRESDRVSRFDQSNHKLRDTVTSLERHFAGFVESSFWVMSLGVTAVWFVAAMRLSSGDSTLSIGDLLAFAGYIWLFYGPLQWFGVIINWMTNTMAASDRIFTILDTKAEAYEPDNFLLEPDVNGYIEFKDVHFSYENGAEIIKGLSFSVKPGEMIGLVGKSGAGKSTIINLICNFYQADSGEILIDGQNIEKYKLKDLRQHIGIVMQEPFLFQGSIKDNIAYNAPDADFSAIVSAAKAAHAHTFIVNKDAGYDSVIGENGIKLSGGERQRIAVARAILQDPKILILDEATSHVDVETEKDIKDAMDNLVKNRTTIAIAHRLATLSSADRLIVIDDGMIAESGTHSELLLKNGIYKRLLDTQSKMNKINANAHIA